MSQCIFSTCVLQFGFDNVRAPRNRAPHVQAYDSGRAHSWTLNYVSILASHPSSQLAREPPGLQDRGFHFIQGGRQQRRSLLIRRTPAGGAARVEPLVSDSQNLKVQAAPASAAEPPPQYSKSDHVSYLNKDMNKILKKSPKGMPRGARNLPKSFKS